MNAPYIQNLARAIDESNDPAWFQPFVNTIWVDLPKGLQMDIHASIDEDGEIWIDWAVCDDGEELALGQAMFIPSGNLHDDLQRYQTTMAPIYARFGVASQTAPATERTEDEGWSVCDVCEDEWTHFDEPHRDHCDGVVCSKCAQTEQTAPATEQPGNSSAALNDDYYPCDVCENSVHIDEHVGKDGEYLCSDCYCDRHN